MFLVSYKLCADQMGGPGELDRRMREVQEQAEVEEYALSDARFDPTVPPPKLIQERTRAAMTLGPPAAKREAK